MKETPVLMKGPLVRRSLSGEKTETRRLVLPAPWLVWSYADHAGLHWQPQGETSRKTPCPYGKLGDTLWVRETYRTEELESGQDGYRMRADNAFVPSADTQEAADRWCVMHLREGWQPSIFMPREACRLRLQIVHVRVERLQDITDDAVRAEGVADLTVAELRELGVGRPWDMLLDAGATDLLGNSDSLLVADLFQGDLKASFRFVWDAINGRRVGARWRDNPWVWALQYRRVS